MKVWKITWTQQRGYDTYDSAVVIAATEEEARATFPCDWGSWGAKTWAATPAEVEVELIGEAAPGAKRGVVLASFNAG